MKKWPEDEISLFRMVIGIFGIIMLLWLVAVSIQAVETAGECPAEFEDVCAVNIGDLP